MAAVTLYLTFSRGAIWVLPVGLVLYVVCAQAARAALRGDRRGPRGRRRLGGLRRRIVGACGLRHRGRGTRSPSRRVDASSRVAWPRRRCERRCCWVDAPAGAGDAAARAPGRVRRRRVLVLVLVGGLAAWARRRRCATPSTRSARASTSQVNDLRDRLTSAVDNGRIEHWRWRWTRSRRSRCTAPARGRTGSPGTASAGRRFKVIDGHSLYLETLAELGVVGLVLLVVVLATILVGAALRLRGEERHAHALRRRGRGDARAARRRGLGLGDAGAVRVVLRRRRGGAGVTHAAVGRTRPHAADRRRPGRPVARDHARAALVVAGPARRRRRGLERARLRAPRSTAR